MHVPLIIIIIIIITFVIIIFIFKMFTIVNFDFAKILVLLYFENHGNAGDLCHQNSAVMALGTKNWELAESKVASNLSYQMF